MAWEILWALVLGFLLAAIVESVVSKRQVARLMPDAKPRSLATAAGLGIASSSCSYAAAALARSLFRKGANLTAVLSFQIASTNLVIELGAILWIIVGWQFTVAEYIGGIVMIIVTAIAMSTVKKATVQTALTEAQEGRAGHMEGHAAMEMTGWRSIPDNFVMEWAAVFQDIAIGLLIAGAIDAWVPMHFWQSFFLTDHPTLAKIWGPIIGPIVAIATFVCSVGNVPLAGVLWHDGMPFGGVVSFLFADLVIVPIVLIYRKYYGRKMATIITGVLWLAATVSGYVCELIFGSFHIPRKMIHEHSNITWNYTTVLDIVALLVAAALVIWFWRKGSWGMLAHMNGAPDAAHEHSHDTHEGHSHVGSPTPDRNDDNDEVPPAEHAQPPTATHHHHH